MSLRGYALALAALTVGFATPAAATTYYYGGHINPTDSGAGNILNYIDRHAPMTFTFTLATALPANMAMTSIKSLVLSWSASGGSVASTITSSDVDAGLGVFSVRTDASGNIDRYNIQASANSAVLPGKLWSYGFQKIADTYDEAQLYTLQFNGVIHYTTLDSELLCMNACGGGTPTSFGILPEASAVPEPATWGMMIVGLGMLGAAMRYRRGGAVRAGAAR